jgi:hypothetical protein
MNEIQRILGEHFENLYSNKVENLEDMAKFLDIRVLTKLNSEDTNHLNKSITSNEIKDPLLNFAILLKKN